jgi:peptidyl-tRNA hydrolase, PTH1 family
VVGLGNPGSQYRATRHNVGADVVALLAERHGGSLRPTRRDRAMVDQVRLGGARVVLAFPQTYMNESGASVAPMVRRLAIGPDRLVVVHDELDLPVGRVKVKDGGGLAGHNGLKSIRAHLHTDAFLRVRIGIGKPPGRQEGADHVLRRPGKADREALAVAVEQAADAVEVIASEGVAVAMNRFNAP